MAELTLPEIEKELTAFFGTALDLTLDQTIFRGFLPGQVINALGVIAESCDTGNVRADIAEFRVQLLGSWRERDQALSMAQRLDSLLPLYNNRYWLVKEGGTAVYRAGSIGQEVWEVSCNLRVSRRVDD